MLLHGCSIPLRTRIIKKPVLPHGLYGIFTSINAVIGENVTIFQQVTIGSVFTKGHRRGAPIIGNNVIIGPGAKIIGKVKIGDGARITANCVVVDDVPENAFVFVDKPRMIIKSNHS